MADTHLTIALDTDLKGRIEAGALEAGVSPAAFAARLLTDQLLGPQGWVWTPESPFEDRTEVASDETAFELAETLQQFHRDLEARLQKR